MKGWVVCLAVALALSLAADAVLISGKSNADLRAREASGQLLSAKSELTSVSKQIQQLKLANADLLAKVSTTVKQANQVEQSWHRTQGALLRAHERLIGLTLHLPSGLTAVCNDFTYSRSLNASGTCSYHGGVGLWVHHP